MSEIRPGTACIVMGTGKADGKTCTATRFLSKGSMHWASVAGKAKHVEFTADWWMVDGLADFDAVPARCLRPITPPDGVIDVARYDRHVEGVTA